MKHGKMRKFSGFCLGVESTADDFGIGICDSNGSILANVIDTYVPGPTGGIHPREAARHHAEVAGTVLQEALERADIDSKSISIVSFAQGPGLGPCLRTGATVARALASFLDIPLVGVNHCIAHVEIGKLKTRANDPVSLYVSGGNTMVVAFDSGRYRVFGETLDIALGNCLDVFAREAGLCRVGDQPLGAIVEECATKGKKLISLPYAVKGMDVSFSGLLTASTKLLKKGGTSIEDLCYSLQENSFSMLTEVTERALAHTDKKEVLLTGGVAANKRLQAMIGSMAKEHDARFEIVPREFAIDNGAMIAWAGLLAYVHGTYTPIEQSHVKLLWRIEEVEASWVA